MRFEVTDRHIVLGVRFSSVGCPVARAASEALGRPVFVTHTYVTSDPDCWVVTSELRARIREYDRAMKVTPFTVELTGSLATVAGEDPAYAG